MAQRTGVKGARVLLVDDEASARKALATLLSQDGYAVDAAADGAAALALCEDHPFDAVVTDLKMPTMGGLELLEKLRARDPMLPVIVVTAFGDAPSAVAAMRAGADDYLVKPVDFDELTLTLERALERRALRDEAEDLRKALREREDDGMGTLVGGSPAMRAVYRLAARVAPARATVLITGESGTGKGELARELHARSPRAKAAFVTLHCAAVPETLLESELFGHERGAFTGAEKRRAGRFEQADGGTLFLDEIGEIPLSVQVKLLRVLQERTFERVGGAESIKVDVRVVAATNRDLAADVAAGRFREDLFYRLNVVQLEMPPLRARGHDIERLAEHFLKRFSEDNRKPLAGFSEKALARLAAHRWPGNVRELENAVERAVVLAEGKRVEETDLALGPPPASTLKGLEIPGATMAEIERYAILATLEAVGGSTTKAAETLDISVRTIQYRLHEYGRATASPAGSAKAKGDA